MGLLDKAKQAMRGRSEKVTKGIDQAVGQVDKRTRGKYGASLRKGAEGLKARARQLDEERGHSGPTGDPGSPGPAGPRP